MGQLAHWALVVAIAGNSQAHSNGSKNSTNKNVLPMAANLQINWYDAGSVAREGLHERDRITRRSAIARADNH